MKQIYTAPDFEVSVYDVEDIITVSVGTKVIDDTGWIDIDGNY